MAKELYLIFHCGCAPGGLYGGKVVHRWTLPVPADQENVGATLPSFYKLIKGGTLLVLFLYNKTLTAFYLR
jgi:hypothetical protein